MHNHLPRRIPLIYQLVRLSRIPRPSRIAQTWPSSLSTDHIRRACREGTPRRGTSNPSNLRAVGATPRPGPSGPTVVSGLVLARERVGADLAGSINHGRGRALMAGPLVQRLIEWRVGARRRRNMRHKRRDGSSGLCSCRQRKAKIWERRFDNTETPCFTAKVQNPSAGFIALQLQPANKVPICHS